MEFVIFNASNSAILNWQSQSTGLKNNALKTALFDHYFYFNWMITITDDLYLVIIGNL